MTEHLHAGGSSSTQPPASRWLRAAWYPSSFAAAKPEAGTGWRCRLATSSILFKDLPIEEACARIAALGFEAVDIWSAFDKCPHLDDAATRLGPSGLKALLAKNHLQLCAFSVYVGGYPKYAELLGGVGGGVAIQGSAGPCKPEELTARMRAFLESLKPLVELAEKNNSRLAIENHGHALLDGPDSFKAFVDLNTSPRLGLALAPYHRAGRRRIRPGSHPDLRPAIAVLLRVAEPAGDGPTARPRPDRLHALAAGAGAGELWRLRERLHARAC